MPASAPGAPRRRRRKWIAIGAVAALLALIVGGGAGILLRDRGDDGGGGKDPVDKEAERQAAIEKFADQDARDVLQAGYDEMSDLDSMSIEARFPSSSDGSRLQADVQFTKGGDCEGTLDYGDGNGTVQMLRVDNRAVVKPDEEFWRNTGPNAQKVIDTINGRWVEAPAMTKTVNTFCDLEKFIGYLKPGPDTEYTNRGLSEVDGYDIVTITEGDNQDSDIHVKADEPHYVTRLQSDEKGYFEFGDFDEIEEFDFPDENDIYNFDM